jgi:hypothetical protein
LIYWYYARAGVTEKWPVSEDEPEVGKVFYD